MRLSHLFSRRLVLTNPCQQTTVPFPTCLFYARCWSKLFIISHLVRNDRLPDFQSAYRKGHSAETAVLKVFSDVVDGIEKGLFALLSLLGLKAAFDTVDHDILLRRMSFTFGITKISLRWFESYLHDRIQLVQLNDDLTRPRCVSCGVLQGSVLGPILFMLYMANLRKIIMIVLSASTLLCR